MKKKLLIVCLTMLTLVAKTQNSGKELINSKIQEFKNHLYLSTSKDPLAILKSRTIKTNELEANDLVYRTTNDVRLKSGDLQGASIDTTHTYPWNRETQDWDTVPTTRIINSYDEHHNLERYQELMWIAETESWQDNIQIFYKYNETNQIVDLIQQKWQIGNNRTYGWANIEHCIYEYNTSGYQNKFINQYWNYDINAWEDSWQQEFSYDPEGNNISILESYWDSGIGEWTPGLNFSNEFDALNRLVLNPIKFWNYDVNDWSNAFQYSFQYNESGDNTNMLLQTWNSETGLWEDCLLKTITYKEDKKIDNYLFQSWDPFTYEWVNNQRGTYNYDEKGNNISIVGENYDLDTESWVIRFTNYFEYNEENKQISKSSLYWDSNLEGWYSGSKTKSAKIDLLALDVKSPEIISTFKVFPNPALDWINIENSSNIDMIEVYDIAGSKIKYQKGTGINHVRLDFADLKAGVYFLKINDINGKSNICRLVKQ